MKTYQAKKEEVDHHWYLVNAEERYWGGSLPEWPGY
jgi:ribosomal protein L13